MSDKTNSVLKEMAQSNMTEIPVVFLIILAKVNYSVSKAWLSRPRDLDTAHSGDITSSTSFFELYFL